MGPSAGGPFHDQEPRVRPVGKRGLRDQVTGQFVVVLVQFRHGEAASQKRPKLSIGQENEYNPTNPHRAGVAMARLRIALCITDLDIGGAEQCLVDLATRMDRGRFRPIVYCLGPRPASDEASCVPRLQDAEVEFHCLGATGFRHILSAAGQLRRLLAIERPDVLQSFSFHANILGRIAAPGRGPARPLWDPRRRAAKPLAPLGRSTHRGTRRSARVRQRSGRQILPASRGAAGQEADRDPQWN